MSDSPAEDTSEDQIEDQGVDPTEQWAEADPPQGFTPDLTLEKPPRKIAKEFMTRGELSAGSIMQNFKGMAQSINKLFEKAGANSHSIQGLTTSYADLERRVRLVEKELIILRAASDGVGSGSTTPGDMIRKG